MGYPVYDIEMFQAEAKVIEVTVVDANGAAVNISGASTIKWVAGKAKETPVIQKSLGSGVTITDGPAGEFSVTLVAADTKDVAADEYPHEARVDNNVIVYGTLNLKYSLTKE
jgi:hypothetical protein